MIESIALRKLLADPDLEVYSQLHSYYFTGAFKTIYNTISEYYAKYGKVPTMEGLKLTTRNAASLMSLSSLELIDVPDEDWEIILDALIDNFTQTEALTKISSFVDSISMYGSEEIKEHLGKIVLDLDEKLDNQTKVHDASSIQVVLPADKQTARTPIGLNEFDAAVGGAYAEKLYMVGGRRGSGKSMFCNNIVNNQYQQGNVSAYFTIEMTQREVFNRSLCILAGVDPKKLEQGTTTPEELIKIMGAKANMYEASEEVFKRFESGEIDVVTLEHLLSKMRLKPNRLVIVDDRSLSLTTIDLELQKLKAQHGDKFKVAVIDYLNQITIDGNSGRDMYDWNYQIQISKQLKNLARKYEICIICPFQTDDNGNVRFARGILDAPDLAWNLSWDKETSQLCMDVIKSRMGGVEEGQQLFFDINGSTLAISPKEVRANEPEKDEDEEVASDSPPWKL